MTPAATPTASASTAPARPSPAERLTVTLLLATLLGLHLLTYNLFPAVWCDEVSFSEPAANAVLYGSFTTQVWHHQPLGTFPTVNCPLYAMSLVPWLAMTGVNLLAIRAFNYLLFTSAAFLVWVISWRLNLLRRPALRVLLVLALSLGYGMSFSYRCSRPDILGMNCVLLMVLSLALLRGRLRVGAVVLLAAASVWIGLQVALYACFAAFLAWVLLRVLRFRDLLLLGAGMIIGAGTLALFLSCHGVLRYLLAIVMGMGGKHYAAQGTTHITAGASLHNVARATVGAYLDDFSTVAVIAGLVFLLVVGWRFLSLKARRLVLFFLCLTFGTPLLFNVAGHYAFYYCYMIYLPALIASWVVIEQLLDAPELPWRRRIALIAWTGAAAAAMLVGLPLRLGLALTCLNLQPRQQLQEIVQSHVRSDEVVFSEYPAFFEAKRVARIIYDFWSSEDLLRTHIPGHSLSPDQKAAVSVMIIRPRDHAHMAAYFGGDWQAVTEPFGDTQDFRALLRLPLIGRKFASHAAQPQVERFQLQIFRRRPPQER